MRKTITAKMGHDIGVRDAPYNYGDPSLGVNTGSSLVSVDCNVLAEAREHNTYAMLPQCPQIRLELALTEV